MTQFIDTLVGIFQSSGFARFGEPGGYLYAVMICVGCFLLYLAIVKEFEPLILLPMAFGMILANLPGSGVIHMEYFVGDGLEHPMWVEILNNGGLADMLYMGVKLGIYPPLIFLGIGTMTDFAPLISNPKSLLLGAAAQFGIFGTYMGARLLAATGLVDFTQKQSAAIAIIGGADGPTAIFKLWIFCKCIHNGLLLHINDSRCDKDTAMLYMNCDNFLQRNNNICQNIGNDNIICFIANLILDCLIIN